MTRNKKIGLLMILMIVITCIIIRQSISLHKGIKSIKLPTRESRQLDNMSIYRGLTVKKLAKRHKVTEATVFKMLEIIPKKGDENISIEGLRKKYKKTQEEMKNNLKKIIGNNENVKGKKYEWL